MLVCSPTSRYRVRLEKSYTSSKYLLTGVVPRNLTKYVQKEFCECTYIQPGAKRNYLINELFQKKEILGCRDPRCKHEYLDKCENTEESQ